MRTDESAPAGDQDLHGTQRSKHPAWLGDFETRPSVHLQGQFRLDIWPPGHSSKRCSGLHERGCGPRSRDWMRQLRQPSLPRAIAAVVLALSLPVTLFGAMAAAATAEAKKAANRRRGLRASTSTVTGSATAATATSTATAAQRRRPGRRRRRRRNDYDHDIDADGVDNAFDADSDASGGPFRASAASAPAPPGFVGLVSDDAFWATDADPTRAGTMAAIAGTGARVLRQSFYWSMIEPQPGQYDFSLYDAYVGAAARANLSILPILFDPPAFRSARPAERRAPRHLPARQLSDFAVFAAALVRRYGPRRRSGRASRAAAAADPLLAGLERAQHPGLLAERPEPGRVRGDASRGRRGHQGRRPGRAGGDRRPERERARHQARAVPPGHVPGRREGQLRRPGAPPVRAGLRSRHGPVGRAVASCAATATPRGRS